MPGYNKQLGGENLKSKQKTSSWDEEVGDKVDNNKREWVGNNSSLVISYRLAKKPFYGHLALTSIKQDFGTINIEAHLSKCLCEKHPHSPQPPSLPSSLPVYWQLGLTLPVIPEVSAQPLNNIVLATKAKPQRITPRGIKEASPGHFSTILVRTGPAKQGKGPHDGEFSAKQLLV